MDLIGLAKGFGVTMAFAASIAFTVWCIWLIAVVIDSRRRINSLFIHLGLSVSNEPIYRVQKRKEEDDAR